MGRMVDLCVATYIRKANLLGNAGETQAPPIASDVDLKTSLVGHGGVDFKQTTSPLVLLGAY